MHLVRLLVCSVLLAGCSSAASPATTPPSPSPSPPAPIRTVSPAEARDLTIAEVLRTDERFTIFRDLVGTTETGIPGRPVWLEVWDWDADRIGDDRDGVTILVPTDEGFAATAPELVAALRDGDLDDRGRYLLIGHHYIHHLLPSADFEAGRQVHWSGAVEATLDPPAWDGRALVQADLRTTNGYIHVIDGPIVPDSVRDRLADLAGGSS